MARTVADKPITTRSSRAKLPSSPNAHFRRLTDRIAIGYRKGAKPPGIWTVRITDENGKATQKRIAGVADDIEQANGADVLNFDQACEAARNVFAPAPTEVSVSKALDEWFAAKVKAGLKERAERSTSNWVARTKTYFEGRMVLDLTKRDIEQYQASYLVGYEADRLRARRATSNREMNALRAVLNLAADNHFPEAARPWAKVKNFAKADAFGKRVVVLDDEQEQAVYAASETEAVRNLWKAGFFTGARYGELVDANVGDLADRRLTVDGKTGRRTMILSPKANALFWSLVEGCNDPNRALLLDEDGNRWHHDHSAGPINRSLKDAPDGTTFYAARHSYITRYLSRGVPPMAVAEQVGTSLQMLEDTYANWMRQDLERWFGD